VPGFPGGAALSETGDRGLNDRWISYTGRYGVAHRREIERGVLQGSVLGPLLWDLGYGWVLRGALFTGLGVVCYADDTLVVAGGDDWDEAARRAEVGVALVVRKIEMLRLRVAPQKSEVLWFHGSRKRPPPGYSISVRRINVGVWSYMKYLGLVLDSRWMFGEHFARLGPRLRGEVAGLLRLFPNLGGPGEEVRRFYAAVVTLIALYGAPVWWEKLRASRRRLDTLRSVQRLMALRIIRGYGTIALEAALVLAGTPLGRYRRSRDARMACSGLRQEGRRADAKDSEARQHPGSAARVREMESNFSKT